MKISDFALKIVYLALLTFLQPACEEQEIDPCLTTQWLQPKIYEIKLAVRISESNPLLPGTIGSQKPWEFKNMVISGTIEKTECNEETTGLIELGNSYVSQEDYVDPPEDPVIHWIGHVVYVYEFDNDKDSVNINLTVKVTMTDGQNYSCSFSKEFSSEDIELVSGEFYYRILLDVYSQTWTKV